MYFKIPYIPGSKTVGELEEMEFQREYRYAMDGKPIRLDIYSRDEKAVYDAEMQNLNHKKVEDYDLPKRSRFYQSVMDTDHLKKKQSYRTLPETNILFICTFDPFGEGLPQYTFRNRCDEAPELALQDGTAKYFFNCTCEREEIPKNMQALYRYIMTGEAVDEPTEKLEEAVEAGRRNEKWRSEYMKELLHEDDIREEGRAEERANTEREKDRAEKEKTRADSLEEKVRELEAIIKKME